MESIEAITGATIRNVLEENIRYEPAEDAGLNVSSEFKVPPWHGKRADYFIAKDRTNYLLSICENFRRRTEDPKLHVDGIEALLAPLVEFRILVSGLPRGRVEEDIVLRTRNILKRLPSKPLTLSSVPLGLDERYFQLGFSGGSEAAEFGAWSSLKVVAWLSINIIKMTIYVAISGMDAFAERLQDYPNLLAELLEASSGMTLNSTSDSERQQWYIVRAAIWSSWQRSTMLYHYASLRQVLERGFVWSEKSHQLRTTIPNPEMSIQEMSLRNAGHGKVRSMCSWAFELLRTEPVCLGMDFRTFHHRYSQLWSDAPARCRKDSPESCAGDDPYECGRFNGMIIIDQSAHDSGCDGNCAKQQWDEFSYREVSGSRAVAITWTDSDGQDNRLKYCSASGDTLAISHVWSHGQGGRPDVGVNTCLHLRYKKIATYYGCKSYWWDSACIPEDHELRSEAIQNINSTFSKSKVMIVCDKDIMKIDISALTLAIEESILATVLVCDWNLRAWTFLESMRARHNIYLLCKDNKRISFFKVVSDVSNYGSIDLAILSLTVPHMLPEPMQGAPRGYRPDFDYDLSKFMSSEKSGEILSYRPASRKGDDVIIWSLLVNNNKCELPEDFWRRNLGELIHTGFLMSSAPRVDARGLSWAPSTPYFKPLLDSTVAGVSSYRAFTGSETMPGVITEAGLVAGWLVFEFHNPKFNSSDDQDAKIDMSPCGLLRKIRQMYLQDCHWGALLRPTSSYRTFEKAGDISTKYRGLIQGTLMVVVGCNSPPTLPEKVPESRGWRWKGVIEWDKNIPLPNFTEENGFLIE